MIQLLSSSIATLACFLLLHHLFASWDRTVVLTRLLAGTLAVGLLLSAMYNYQESPEPYTLATSLMLAYRAFALGLALSWPFWLGLHSTTVERPVDDRRKLGMSLWK